MENFAFTQTEKLVLLTKDHIAKNECNTAHKLLSSLYELMRLPSFFNLDPSERERLTKILESVKELSSTLESKLEESLNSGLYNEYKHWLNCYKITKDILREIRMPVDININK